MAAARPSKAAIKNVIDALLAAGFEPGLVEVNADGSFRVPVRPPVDATPKSAQPSAPKWGQVG